MSRSTCPEGALAALAALALVAQTAEAQPACGPDPSAATAVHSHGLQLFNDGQVDAACVCFDHALTLEARATTQLAAARCREEQRRFLQSHSGYRRAAELAHATDRPDVQAAALEGMARVEVELGRVRVVVPPGYRGSIELGDETIPLARAGEIRFVEPDNDVRVVFQPSGVVQIVRPTRGGLVEVHAPASKVALEPAGPPAVAPPPRVADGGALSPLTIGGIGVGAAGAALLGVSLGLGVAAHGKREDSDAHCDLGAKPITCDDRGLELFEEGQSLALASDVTLGLGVALAAGGLVMAIVGATRAPDPPNVTFAPAIGATGAGVGVSARF